MKNPPIPHSETLNHELNSTLLLYIAYTTDYISLDQLISLQQLLNALNISHAHLQPIPSTPPNTPINAHKTWASLTLHPWPLHTQLVQPLPDYYTNLAPKFLPLFSYYTDSLFTPPKKEPNCTWRCEWASYGIYNLGKGITILERLPGLQNILHAEILTIHHTLQIITHQFPDESTYIFTDSLTSLYLLIKQLKHGCLQETLILFGTGQKNCGKNWLVFLHNS